MNFWDVVGFFFWTWVVVAYLMVLFWILSDLFRDHALSGWFKAIWIFFLIFVPFLTALVYLIARGASMNERAGRNAGVVPEDYSKPAPSATPAADIAQAKALLDAGTINQREYDALKAKAMGEF
ncbi:SHOCT domain-containing protein [Microterricola gilva]|nr:SHOCT domain-containing protein [Microterricola gilva]